jgi:secreted trypsin-like serine protease
MSAKAIQKFTSGLTHLPIMQFMERMNKNGFMHCCWNMSNTLVIISNFWCEPQFADTFRNWHLKLFTGSSVCNGDSGSGMVFPESQRDGTQMWKLRGIVSNSKPDDDNKKLCDITSYIVFTDIAQYLEWISSLII